MKDCVAINSSRSSCGIKQAEKVKSFFECNDWKTKPKHESWLLYLSTFSPAETILSVPSQGSRTWMSYCRQVGFWDMLTVSMARTTALTGTALATLPPAAGRSPITGLEEWAGSASLTTLISDPSPHSQCRHTFQLSPLRINPFICEILFDSWSFYYSGLLALPQVLRLFHCPS